MHRTRSGARLSRFCSSAASSGCPRARCGLAGCIDPIGDQHMTQRRSGQRRSRTEIASLARSYTETVLKMLAGLVTREDVSPTARIAAGVALLDRGWGKPTQSVNENDERPQITEVFNRI